MLLVSSSVSRDGSPFDLIPLAYRLRILQARAHVPKVRRIHANFVAFSVLMSVFPTNVDLSPTASAHVTCFSTKCSDLLFVHLVFHHLTGGKKLRKQDVFWKTHRAQTNATRHFREQKCQCSCPYSVTKETHRMVLLMFLLFYVRGLPKPCLKTRKQPRRVPHLPRKCRRIGRRNSNQCGQPHLKWTADCCP